MRRHVDEVLEELITQTRLSCYSDCRFCLDSSCILKSATVGDGGKCLEYEQRKPKEAPAQPAS